MAFVIDWATLLVGVLVMFSRIADVSIGTLRTISIVQGRTRIAFFLGITEISLWLVVISAVLTEIRVKPILGVFYALGFACGNVVGIKIEKRLAYGHQIVRVITHTLGRHMADEIRKNGFAVTVIPGEGMAGPVQLLYIVCRRRDVSRILSQVQQLDPDAFFTTEQAGQVNKMFTPIMPPATGWRAIFKKK